MAELMAAVLISSIFAASLASAIGQSTRIARSSQDQILAADIAQELIDNARNTSYTALVTKLGTHNLTNYVNKSSTDGQTNSITGPRPLLLDISNTWSLEAKKNAFLGTVTETIANGPYANTVKVTITINWKESTGAFRSYSLSTLISQDGIHN